MNQKALKTLEYDKIIVQLAEYASCESGKELCRRLVPSIDYDEIVTAQRETTDAVTRVRQKGGISFGGGEFPRYRGTSLRQLLTYYRGPRQIIRAARGFRASGGFSGAVFFRAGTTDPGKYGDQALYPF